MNRCKNCNVLVDNRHSVCPLCHKEVGKAINTITQFPSYEDQYKKIKSFTFQKLLFFLSLVAGITCVAINLFTLKFSTRPWSLVVVVSLAYAWVIAKNTIASKMHVGGKILIQYVTISIFIFVLDAYSGLFKWSTNYVIPFLAVAATLLINIILLSKKSKWNEYMGYMFAAIFINIIPLLLYFCRLATVLWTSTVPLIHSVVTLLGFYIFLDKKFKEEVKKRFHF